MPQMRKQDKPPEKEEMKVIKIPDAEFKTMDIRMLKDLRGGADYLSKNFNKDSKH